MLPESSIEETDESVNKSNRAFEIDFENKKTGGIIEGKQALMQSVRIALITQRYRYPVFSHAYGTDLEKAFEDGYVMAMGKVKNAIYDSLICDDRILGVDSFEFERQGTRMIVKFNIKTVYGDYEYETEVG